MPTIFIGGFKFRFYSSDAHEAPHSIPAATGRKRGVNTLTAKAAEIVRAKSIRFANGAWRVSLDDGREIGLRLNEVPWLKWPARATPEQRASWTIEPGWFRKLLAGFG